MLMFLKNLSFFKDIIKGKIKNNINRNVTLDFVDNEPTLNTFIDNNLSVSSDFIFQMITHKCFNPIKTL